MAYIGIEIMGTHLHRDAEARLHLTLAHFKSATPPQVKEMLPVLRRCSRLSPSILTCGIGVFQGDAVLLVEKRPALMLLREAVLDLLKEVGVSVSTDHTFTPHITVGDFNPATHALLLEGRGCCLLRAGALELAGTKPIVRYSFPFEDLDAEEMRPSERP